MCNGTVKLNEYNNHISLCYKIALDTTSDKAIIQLPKAGSYMKFKNYKNKLIRPYIVYLDFECTLKPEEDKYKHTRHVANSACYYFVCNFDSSRNKLVKFIGENCVIELLLSLYKLAEKCIAEMLENQKMEMTQEDKNNYLNAKRCHICRKTFF